MTGQIPPGIWNRLGGSFKHYLVLLSTIQRNTLRNWIYLPGILFILTFAPTPGLTQNTSTGLKIFENGSATLTGPDAGMFPDSPTRQKIGLAGSWEYSLDGERWQEVLVPSAFDYSGSFLLRRFFEVSADLLDGHQFNLVLYGVNYQTEITVNGRFVGRHTGGYTSQVIPIQANVLQVGTQNVIVVSIDNTLTPRTTVPPRQHVGEWRTYGGIYRDIYILVTPEISIGDVSWSSDLGERSRSVRVEVTAQVASGAEAVARDSTGTLGFTTEVLDKLTLEHVSSSSFTRVVPEPSKTVTVSSSVSISSPKLWSPDSPDLYVVKCSLVRRSGDDETLVDEHSFDLGLRELDWSSGRLSVNGTPVELRGVLWQEEHVLYGSALPYEIFERDIAAIKTLGANLVRFLYPPHPYIVNLCDRYGLLVMEEIPLHGVPTEILSQDFYQELTTGYLREMVWRDRSHASVIGWGIGGDFESSAPLTCDVITGMRNVVMASDTTRPVYYTARTPEDPCFEYVDLIALSALEEDATIVRDSVRRWKSLKLTKPVILVRYGKEVEPGNRNGYSDPLSLEAQARFAMLIFETVKDAPFAGSVLWSYNDWNTDRPALSSHSADPYLRAMGIVDGGREHRIAFDVVRSLFHGEKVYALPVGNYSSGAPVVFVIAGLVILITFAFIYNGNRRFRDAVNRSLVRTYNFFADVRDQRIVTYSHSLLLALIVSITWAILLSSVLTFYRNSLLLDNLLSYVMSDSLKVQFVTLVWNPPEFIMVVSALVFLKLIILSLMVKCCSMMVRTQVSFYHAFSVTMWSVLPYIIFIPVAMVLYRLMDTEFYITPLLVLMGLVSIWVLMRLFKGIAIIFDVFQVKVYAVGLLVLLTLSVALYTWLDYSHSTSLYLKHVQHLVNRTT